MMVHSVDGIDCVMQHATTTDGALEMYPGAGVANIGIMLFRSTAKIFAEVLTMPLCLSDSRFA